MTSISLIHWSAAALFAAIAAGAVVCVATVAGMAILALRRELRNDQE